MSEREDPEIQALSDDDLESVSGGDVITTASTCSTSAGTCSTSVSATCLTSGTGVCKTLVQPK